MGWRDWMKGSPAEDAGTGSGAVRRIAAELAAMPESQARYLAAVAYVLGRVAHADERIGEGETARMEALVLEAGAVSPSQVALAVELAKAQNRLFGHPEKLER